MSNIFILISGSHDLIPVQSTVHTRGYCGHVQTVCHIAKEARLQSFCVCRCPRWGWTCRRLSKNATEGVSKGNKIGRPNVGKFWMRFKVLYVCISCLEGTCAAGMCNANVHPWRLQKTCPWLIWINIHVRFSEVGYCDI